MCLSYQSRHIFGYKCFNCNTIPIMKLFFFPLYVLSVFFILFIIIIVIFILISYYPLTPIDWKFIAILFILLFCLWWLSVQFLLIGVFWAYWNWFWFIKYLLFGLILRGLIIDHIQIFIQVFKKFIYFYGVLWWWVNLFFGLL